MKLKSHLLAVATLGFAISAQALNISPDSVDFGTVPVGAAANFTFFVTNDSSHNFKYLTSITSERPDRFGIAASDCPFYPLALPPRASCAVTVVYAPFKKTFIFDDSSEYKVNYMDQNGDNHDKDFDAKGHAH